MFKYALRVVALLALVASAALCQTKISVDSKKVAFMVPTGIFVPQGQSIIFTASGTVTLSAPNGGTGELTTDAIGVIQTAPADKTDLFNFLTNVALPPGVPPSPGKLKFPPGPGGLTGAYGALVLGISPNQCGASSTADFPQGLIVPGPNPPPLPLSGGYIYLGVQKDMNVVASGTYEVTISLSGSASPPAGCTPGLSFLNPAPTLLVSTSTPAQPYAITTSTAVLAGGAPVVTGVAADGVSQVLIRSQGLDPTHVIAVVLLDENNGMAPGNGEDGSLVSLFGGSVPLGQAVIPTVQTFNGISYVFVAYLAPIDFARASGGDNTTASRKIGIVVFDITDNSVVAGGQLDLWRPPIFFVHGLWGKVSTWDEFDPALKQQIQNIETYKADYENHNGDSISVNTPDVLNQAYTSLSAFRLKHNVAASQMDFIVHSMGGLISDTMPTLPAFRMPENFGQGVIHKLITIDTPYQGSALATGLYESQGSCKALLGLTQGKVGGAVFDLRPFSGFLHNFNPAPGGFAKHAIASFLTADQEQSADSKVNILYSGVSVAANGASLGINDFCDKVFEDGNSPAPPSFSFTLFYNLPGDVFGGAHDLIVSEKSQLGPYVPGTTGTTTFGLAHSQFMVFGIGFPGSLDQGVGSPVSNPVNAFNLLNTPTGNTSVFVH